MNAAILVALILNLVLVGGVLLLVRRIHRHSTALSEKVSSTTALVGIPPQVDSGFSAGKPRLITVEILNPLELAATQNRFAGIAGAVAPERIRKIVYERAALQMTEQLIEQGIDVDVQVHVGA
ncbi:hypothetical protein [Antrihabitans cavernicola]|uniref:Uncharacterized protein n=1 Tax=Antrihabitans cavernicola TaxID=2495913 RepID=A0A5A7SJZ7_9NOCA|nr:hypothetical protein [Spelaeibacter cavernicola]KAA0024765.1 hypothetical protein FOY51_02185 [Spelaeibacter cavernicola]